MSELLRLEGVSMQFGGLKALDDISFSVQEGEIVGLIGPNGAGKTTLFNCLTQFYKEYTGAFILNHEGKAIDLKDKAVTEIIDLGIARTFQNIELIPDLSILDNVLIGAHSKIKSTFLSDLLNRKKKKEEAIVFTQKAIDILSHLHIDHLKDAYVSGQPYGILKKIEIARTLMSDPKLIILDEPAAGLNDLETDELESILRDVQKTFDVTLLIIEHDMGFVMNLCDKVCAINFGKFLAMDTPLKIQQNKEVIEAYLGKEDDDA